MVIRRANHISYKSIYGASYPGHSQSAASFPAESPALIASLIRELGFDAAVDIGAGNGCLGTLLKAHGLDVTSFDIRAFPDQSVLAFDLTSTAQADIRAALTQISAKLRGKRYVTLCLDVLEHLDPADIVAALGNLASISGEYLLCSISTRPSSDHNLYHATIVPTSTWEEAFEAMGFEKLAHPLLEQMGVRHNYPTLDSLWIIHQWRMADPYREAQKAEPNYLLFRRRSSGSLAPSADILDHIRHIMRDRSKPCPVALPGSAGFHFLVGHPQNFSLYEPFWDSLPNDCVNVWVRQGVEMNIENRRLSLILAWLKCRGISHELVHSTEDIHWKETNPESAIFLSASESTASDCHLQNLAFVAQARLHGFFTALLQHGIWIEDFPLPITFLSRVVLSWAREHEECFRKPAAALATGGTMTRGLADASEFVVTGCPKFDAYFQSSPLSFSRLLGKWTETFQTVVLVTTNLGWVRSRTPAKQFYHRMIELAGRKSEVLFVVKMHPGEDQDAAILEGLPANIVVLSDPVCFAAGLRTSDLVRACDAVISTLSTVALEAALADKPFFLIDSGTGLQYQYLGKPGSIDQVEDFLDGAGGMPESVRKFRDYYYDGSTRGQALENCLKVLVERRFNAQCASTDLSPVVIVAAALGALASHLSRRLLTGRPQA